MFLENLDCNFSLLCNRNIIVSLVVYSSRKSKHQLPKKFIVTLDDSHLYKYMAQYVTTLKLSKFSFLNKYKLFLSFILY